MKEARNWLANDRRAQRTFWLLVAVSIFGAIVSLASYKQHHLINDIVLLLNVSLIAAVVVARALAVNTLWLGALGVSLEVAGVALHWHPVRVIDLLVPFPGWAVLWVLVFYMHPPSPRDSNNGATNAVNASVLSVRRRC